MGCSVRQGENTTMERENRKWGDSNLPLPERNVASQTRETAIRSKLRHQTSRSFAIKNRKQTHQHQVYSEHRESPVGCTATVAQTLQTLGWHLNSCADAARTPRSHRAPAVFPPALSHAHIHRCPCHLPLAPAAFPGSLRT